VANKKGSASGAVEDFGEAVDEYLRSASDAVLDQQKAVWSSFRDIASTWADDTANQGARETAKLMMSSFLEFAGMEREMRKQFVALQVDFADKQIALLESHRRSVGAKKSGAKKKTKRAGKGKK
jgi:hypothetical protein